MTTSLYTEPPHLDQYTVQKACLCVPGGGGGVSFSAAPVTLVPPQGMVLAESDLFLVHINDLLNITVQTGISDDRALCRSSITINSFSQYVSLRYSEI